jgi:hypothetical protein
MDVAEIKFTKAIAKGELVQYLGGYPAYFIQERFADMPTDYSAAFTPIDDRIQDDTELQQMIVDAIILLAKDPEYGWGAIHHLGNLAIIKRNKGVDLLSPDLLDEIASSLRLNKETFKALKKWEGKNHEDGVWSQVRVQNKILHLRHNITVLPEEL